MTHRVFRIVLLLLLVAVTAVSGVRGAVRLEDPERIDLLLGLALRVGFPLLCRVDSVLIGKPVIRAFLWLTFFAWPVLAPGYLVWSRGLKGVGLAIVFGALFLFAFAMAYAVTALVLYGPGWLLG